jgi:DNA-binding Lrp family transcriptional regulator
MSTVVSDEAATISTPSTGTKTVSVHEVQHASVPNVVPPTSNEKLIELELPSGNDLAVLQAVAGNLGPHDESGKVSFQGIRRKLGLHQETLSRSLRRLEGEGLIEKIDHDYTLSERGASLVAGNTSAQLPAIYGEVYAIPIMRTIVPPDASIPAIERSLSHRWFGNLRWYGSSTTEDSTILRWITEDGKIKLLARISEGYLSIESEATTKGAMEQAVSAAYEIFDHVSHHLRRQKTGTLLFTSKTPTLYNVASDKIASGSSPSSI